MYVKLSFGFFYGRYVFRSKLKVTSKKLTFVKFVVISISKSILDLFSHFVRLLVIDITKDYQSIVSI